MPTDDLIRKNADSIFVGMLSPYQLFNLNDLNIVIFLFFFFLIRLVCALT